VHGYYPEDNVYQAYLIDSIIDFAEDIIKAYLKIRWAPNEVEKEKETQNFLSKLPGWLEAIEKRLK
jgi:hypothetical protein